MLVGDSLIETKQVEFKVNDLIIQSNDLIEAYYDNELTTLEHKFIRYVASKIKKNDSQFPDYTITVKEFAEVMNVKGNNYHSQVKELADDLTRKRIKIRSSNDKMGWFPWFSAIIYDNGTVHVSFNPIIKDYLISLDSRFTGYSFDDIKKLKSGYTVRVYELLKQYEKIGKRTIELDELKRMIGVGDKYPVYGNFKQRILNVAKKELEATGELYFSFKEVKQGRKTVAIDFNIHKKSPKQQTPLSKEAQEFIESVKKSLYIHGIDISDKKILTWKKYGIELILEVLEEIKHRDIENYENYISKVLKSKYENKDVDPDIGKEENTSKEVIDDINEIDESLLNLARQNIVAKYAPGKELIPDYFLEKEVIPFFMKFMNVSEKVASELWEKYKTIIMYQIKTKKDEQLQKRYNR